MNYYINRELSWLKFNGRVLEQAGRSEVPALEQMKFVSIFCSNLDEFFMVRVGGLYDLSLIPDSPPDNKTGMTASEQLTAIYAAAGPLYRRAEYLYAAVNDRLANLGVTRVLPWEEGEMRRAARRWFHRELLPTLSPVIADSRNLFPHLENKRLYAAFLLERDLPGKTKGSDRGRSVEKTGSVQRFTGIVPLPYGCPPYALLDGNETSSNFHYVLPADLLLTYADELFEDCRVTARAIVRVTRNADVEIADSLSDEEYPAMRYPEYVKAVIKSREKMAPVRLELYSADGKVPEKLFAYFTDKLVLREEQCYTLRMPPDLSYVWPLCDHVSTAGRRTDTDISDLLHTPCPPKNDPSLSSDIWDAAKKRDIFMSLPYRSMRPYLRLLSEAADDPDVESIKITLYRLCTGSEVAASLIRAAENGKEVTIVIELKARFDESANVNWGLIFEEAGCRVIYGIEGLKVHSKVTLITARRNGKLERVVHLGTGNYNEKTARLYTDVGVITTDSEICEDCANLFEWLEAGDPSEAPDCPSLLVAPHTLRSGITEEIKKEAAKGKDGYIFMKMNGMTDRNIIDALVEASQAGAKVDLLVRGICCLQTGIPGISDNITVTSIVGRLLEHARVFIFGKGSDRRVYFGSADMMTRNTTRRVELTVLVRDPAIADELCRMADLQLRDNVKSSRQCSNGEYERVFSAAAPVDSQDVMLHEEIPVLTQTPASAAVTGGSNR